MLCFWLRGPGVHGRAAGVTLSRKGAKSRTGGHKLRSTGTKASARRVRSPSKKKLTEKQRELAEARQQQTATAEVLRIISRSSFDLRTVLETLVDSAVRLCHADKGNIARVQEGGFKFVAFSGFTREYTEYMAGLPLNRTDRGSITGRTVIEGRTVHIPDVLADPEFTWFEAQKRGGFRTGLGVPLLRDGAAIGVFFLTRATIDPFTPQQIELVTMFADQAVIAIENARLFDEVQQRTNELRQRTDDLSESLRQQIATAEMLKIISRSSFDLKTVLDTLVETAARLCHADKANIARLKDDQFHYVAFCGFAPEYTDYMKALTMKVDRGSISGRAVLERKTIHVQDVLADPEFTFLGAQKRGGFRTALGVPLLREGIPIGVLFLTRAAIHPFTRPSRDSDRECAAIRDGAAAHSRTQRISPAADRHGGCAQGHQPVGLRSASSVGDAGGECRQSLQRGQGLHLQAGRRALSRCSQLRPCA
jgi:two-component system, NtrC family, sensor kinase